MLRKSTVIILIIVLLTLTFVSILLINTSSTKKEAQRKDTQITDQSTTPGLPEKTGVDDYEEQTKTVLRLQKDFPNFPTYFGSVLERKVNETDTGYEIDMLVAEELSTITFFYLEDAEHYGWLIVREPENIASETYQSFSAELDNRKFDFVATKESDNVRVKIYLTDYES